MPTVKRSNFCLPVVPTHGSSPTVSGLECYWGVGEEVPDTIKTCKPDEGQDVCILHFVEGEIDFVAKP